MCEIFKLIPILALVILSTAVTAQEIKPIPRKVPPQGIKVSDVDKGKIEQTYNQLISKLSKINHIQKADVEIYSKAVKYALINGEFYKPADTAKALKLLDIANKKADLLLQNRAPWVSAKGVVVRGFYSAIDGSPQPYGVEIPNDLDLSKKQPVYIWLHGRGDKVTDLHFLAQRESAKLKYPNEKAITVHPFGRQCIGYKSAGETDILEVIEHLKKNYNIDEDRIALMGFSMGGAGAWHLGAHFADRWAAVHAGAGFAETAQYNNMTKENYPPWYTQKLWGLNDVPNYTRKLFNQPLVAYSGENDKQIQAARVMEASFKEHGMSFPHLIGPKMGHKYAEGYMGKVLDIVRPAVEKGRDSYAKKVYFQTQTLRYPKMHWVNAHGLIEHWNDSRVDAEVKDNSVELKTKNISRLKLTSPWKDSPFKSGTEINIDGTKLSVKKSSDNLFLVNSNGWSFGKESDYALVKKPGLQGPIDDAFVSPFLVIVPTGNTDDEKRKRWVDFEVKHLAKRWRELFRGTIRIKQDTKVTDDDIKNFNLIIWGAPQTNSVLKRIAEKLPVKWQNGNITVNGKNYDDDYFVPQFIYPNPLNSGKYVVINSGPTFRENHDRTNSLQNPKLPDWAVIDIRQDPDGDVPGKVVDTNFFDENWQWKK